MKNYGQFYNAPSSTGSTDFGKGKAMKLFIAITTVFLFSSLGFSQSGLTNSSERNLGDVLFTIDIESITGDDRCLGIEFDGSHYWATGVHGFTKTYLYEFTPEGTLVNQYEQPPAHWGGWGWRDLAYDGHYLYAGDPNREYIQQIDPADGQVTGIEYGPMSILPCRAMGYSTASDSFWTANFSSGLYECFRDNTYNFYPNPGISMSGVAFEESDPSHPMGWWVGMDGGGGIAMEFDPGTGGFTGKTFMLPGAPNGACAFDTGKGAWALAVIVQGVPDQVMGFDLDAFTPQLELDSDTLASWMGGTLNFSLEAGAAHAHRFYGLFGSASGNSPGTLLPGGSTTLPINWDVFTDLLLSFSLPGFMGFLDNQGNAAISLPLAPFALIDDAHLTFAYALQGPPWDVASNSVELHVKADYRYDDGTTEGTLFPYMVGDQCRLHRFDTIGATETIEAVSLAWGSPVFPGYYPGNGTPSRVFVWDDPNNDGNPIDCVLLGYKDTVVQNVDTDILTKIDLDSSVTVSGVFFVGSVTNYSASSGVLGMDTTSPHAGDAWMSGNASGVFDYQNMGNNFYNEMGSIGFPGCFLLRAIP